MDKLRSFFLFGREMLKLNLMSGMAYRASFISQVIFMMLNNAFFLVFWWVFFSRFQSVQGWRMQDVLVLFSISASGFGLAVMFFGNSMRLSTLIQEGQIDYYLSLPPNPLLHILMSRMIFSGLGDLIFGLLLFLFFTEIDPTKVVLFFLFVPVSACIFVSFFVIVHSLTFFAGSAEGMSNFLSEALLTFSLYPESLFSGGIKIILFTILPAGFVSYLPVALLKEFSWWPFWALVGFAIGLAILACKVFYSGLLRYESGNLISPRM